MEKRQWKRTDKIIAVIIHPQIQSAPSENKSLWKQNIILLRNRPMFFWYFSGICGILLQAIGMILLAFWQLIKIFKHDYLNLKSSVAVVGLFFLFTVYLAINLWQTFHIKSRALGGTICCEILFIPIAYYLLHSDWIISLGLFITVLLTIPVFPLRSTYCASHHSIAKN